MHIRSVSIYAISLLISLLCPCTYAMQDALVQTPKAQQVNAPQVTTAVSTHSKTDSPSALTLSDSKKIWGIIWLQDLKRLTSTRIVWTGLKTWQQIITDLVKNLNSEHDYAITEQNIQLHTPHCATQRCGTAHVNNDILRDEGTVYYTIVDRPVAQATATTKPLEQVEEKQAQ